MSGTPISFRQHPLREEVLQEIHARPFFPASAPKTVLHYAFLTDSAFDPANASAPQHPIGGSEILEGDRGVHGAVCRIERHTEFTTYTWYIDDTDVLDGSVGPFDEAFVPNGPLIVALRLQLIKDERSIEEIVSSLDATSLAVSDVHQSRASIASDFRTQSDGFVQLLAIDRDLTGAQEAGSLVQRFLELETYRTLALLGLPEARRLQPQVRRIETELVECTLRLRTSGGLDADKKLLADLTGLADDLEAGAAASAYRFGASRAYSEIMALRLKAMEETARSGYSSFTALLGRRLTPAMRTCQSIEARQRDSSRKLARTTALLRTRIDLELAEQNKALLHSMDRRAQLQLRLQHTVEGLSIAAVTYYMVGLIGYLAKGTSFLGFHLDPSIVTAASVVPIAIILRVVVGRIRSQYHDSANTVLHRTADQ